MLNKLVIIKKLFWFFKNKKTGAYQFSKWRCVELQCVEIKFVTHNCPNYNCPKLECFGQLFFLWECPNRKRCPASQPGKSLGAPYHSQTFARPLLFYCWLLHVVKMMLASLKPHLDNFNWDNCTFHILIL